MVKFTRLKLSKIKYTGDSIGDDIRVEIEILDKFLRIDKTIKVGTTTEIDKEIGSFATDRKLFEAGVRITVIEKDLLFNDAGSVKNDIKIDTSLAKPQRFAYKVRIKETRSILGKDWGKAVAVFEITLEAEVSDVIKYVPDEGDGWLKVVLEDRQTEESLPAHLKVKIDRIDAGREHFSILEGPYRGRRVSVKLKNDDTSQFIVDVVHEPMAQATYSISKKIFILNGRKYKTVDYPEVPWRKGLYDIELPDYPHKGGRNYLDQSKRAMTWFRIGHRGDRYLHAGGRSLGCMTIIEIKRWMEIYNVLIKARKGDFVSVGVIKIVD